MTKLRNLKLALACSASLIGMTMAADASDFNIPAGNLATALDAYTAQTGVQLLIADDQVRVARTRGARGELTADVALSRILAGTGLVMDRHPSGVIAIVRQSSNASAPSETRVVQTTPLRVAVAAAAAGIESVVVTSSKIKGDIQTVPIAITALSQEQLTARQIAGGPDLVKEVPNLTFTKTNFSGYSIQIRGIGTQAISVTTDPAVAVAFNDTPFIRNHFFEQEFYDVGQVEILRGPQGTLYGRNATAGVVNLISAKPTDQFEAMLSADWGNYHNRRYEGMVNIPIVDDRLDIRIAAEWTKRDGYNFNEYTNSSIDGRDLWSGRVTIGFKPTQDMQMYLVWEHFSENDDRIRSAKQLCTQDPGVGSIDGVPKPLGPNVNDDTVGDYFDQGCMAGSLYSPHAFEAPIGYTLPYIIGGQILGRLQNIDPYASETQTPDLRVINSSIDPIYRAKNDVAELNTTYALSPSLTFASQTGFSQDFLYSAEDFNRFGATGGLFPQGLNNEFPGIVSPEGVFCDPQLGCSDRLILEDLSQEHAWQLSQEFRLESQFSGPLNFSVGGNYLHYETQENYYVFSNVFTMITAGCASGRPCHFQSGSIPYVPNVFDNSVAIQGFEFNDPSQSAQISGGYIDPNPLASINDNGHNYFLSQNPYVLNSYAAFGEANYNISPELKIVAGLRWTDDQKHFVDIPSWLVSSGWGYPVAGTLDQQWRKLTGRAVVNWTPKLDFTDQTLVYGSYAHGYKAGGANPPGAIYSTVAQSGGSLQPTHPLTFKPEFVDAFELGTKNTLLDGALTLNGDVFYYNYQAYQVSQIVDRTAINLNFDAHAGGAELEATWEPLPGLSLNFAGGWEHTSIAKGESAVDLMDRTAGQEGWYVLRPFVNESSNCVVPGYVAKHITFGATALSAVAESYCALMYLEHLDPLTRLTYKADPTVAYPGLTIPAGYPGFDPRSAPNNGAGFSKDLSGNSLPNAPPYTVSFGAQYSLPLSDDWAGTLRGDFYWQDASWWRVFNDLSYDRLHGYTSINLALILTSGSGWQVMLYDKNVFNKTAITGAFLNSDDTDLTTNVFLTDPRLIGVRVTKNW